MKTFKLVKATSYGDKVYKTPILDNASIADVKAKYLSMAGNELGYLFDRNFNENNKVFTLPYSAWDTFIVTEN